MNCGKKISVRISQMGSRERYAMARGLHRSQMLELFCTDFWNPFGKKVKRIASLLHSEILDKIAYNFHNDLPREKIRAFNLLGIKARLAYRTALRKSSEELHNQWIQFGKDFALAVNKLPKGDHNVFLGYSTASLESLEYEQRLGNLTIVNQLEPGKLEESLVSEEQRRWPGWSLKKEDIKHEEYYRRLEKEWLVSDVIIVNSSFSKSTLLAQGVPGDKIAVVPLPLPEDEVMTTKKDSLFDGGILNVLWVSNVMLRKGIPYLIEAAKLLKNDPVKFTVVGKLNIDLKAIKNVPDNVEFKGRVPYSMLQKIYTESDIFLLPTISEGFARVQLEALACGLPVITTPNCGEVVSNGHDGFIVPIRDSKAIADAIRQFLDNPSLVQLMSANAKEKVKAFTLEACGHHLSRVIEKAMQSKC
jgi:glycosyltransferase involved in cell wall biosynthesis